MKNSVTKFLNTFRNILDQNKKFLTYSLGIEFQKQAILDLERLQKRTVKIKNKMIVKKDEESSNILLSLESLLGCCINELRMLVFLKNDQMRKAWESLVLAQHCLRTAFQANDIILKFDGNTYLKKLALLEKLFFPPQTFTSIGAVFEKSECSICNKEYGSCNHVKGRPYMGSICYEKMTKLKEMLGLSIVDDPGSKMNRVIAVCEDDGWRDLLTWRIAKKV